MKYEKPRWGDAEWRVPPADEQEPGVLYQQPLYTQKLYERITAIEVCGIRFAREKTCSMATEFRGTPCNDYRCSACGKLHNAPRAHSYCPRCGAKVTDVDGRSVEEES